MNMLELRRVSKVYGQGAAEVHALDRVTLSVDEGAMVAMRQASMKREVSSRPPLTSKLTTPPPPVIWLRAMA